MRPRELLTLPATAAVGLVLWGTLHVLGPTALWVGAWIVWWPHRRHTVGRTLRNLLLAALAFWILHKARWVVYPLFGGILLAYVLAPSVDWLVKRHIRRPLAVLLSLVPLGAATALALILLVPAVVGQASDILSTLPEVYAQLEQKVRPALEHAGLGPRDGLPAAGSQGSGAPAAARSMGAGGGATAGPPESTKAPPPAGTHASETEASRPAEVAGTGASTGTALPESAAFARGSPRAAARGSTGGARRPPNPVAPESLASAAEPSSPEAAATAPLWLQELANHAETVLRTGISGLSDVGKGLGKALRWLGVLVLMPFLAFYLLVDWSRVGHTILGWVPPSRHTVARRLSTDLRIALSVYLRGQLAVAAIEAVLFSILYRIAGLTDPVALGVLSGMFSLIPFIGFAGTILLVLLAGVTGPDPIPSLVKSGIGLALINTLEGQVLIPKIQGSGFGLHPLIVIVGVLFFGSLFGFIGVILAVPAMAIIKGFLPGLREGWEFHVLQAGESPPEADDDRG